MKNFKSIDLLKYILSIMVIIIHTNPFLSINKELGFYISYGICRIAVPCFFIISAYFYFSKGITKENTIKYCKRLLILYFAWFIIAIPNIIYFRLYCGSNNILIKIFNLIKGFFFSSTFAGSWFLTSCMFCGILFYFLHKFKSKKFSFFVITFLSVLVYIFCVLGSSYGNFINNTCFNVIYVYWDKIFGSFQNGFIVGIPYFYVGSILYYNNVKINNKSIITGLFISLFLLMIEVYFTHHLNLILYNDCYFLLLPTSVFLFLLCKNSNININNHIFLRKSSIIIYLSHFIFLAYIKGIAKIFHFEIANIYWFLSVLILCLLFSTLIIRFSEKIKWLKYLY